MQIFELYSAIGTPVLTKWIGRTKTFQTWRSNWYLYWIGTRDRALCEGALHDSIYGLFCDSVGHTFYLDVSQ